MVVIMEFGATEAQIEAVINNLNAYGFDVHRSSGVNHTVIGAIGVKPEFDPRFIKVLSGVSDVRRVTEPYKFASRSWKRDQSVYELNGVLVGGSEVVVMAGPCSVESPEQMDRTAAHVAACGATFLRGGCLQASDVSVFVPGAGRRRPSIFARRGGSAPPSNVITEVTHVGKVDLVQQYTDVFQVGARNMQNFDLLKELGRSDKPVFLKRGLSATIDEWLMAAEYVMSQGNPHVILCERGIRTFESYTRNTLDLSAVAGDKEEVSPARLRRSKPRNRYQGQGHAHGASGSGGGGPMDS